MLIKQLTNLRKVRSKNLKFRTDHHYEVASVNWLSITQQMIIYSGWLLKIEASPLAANKKSKLVQPMMINNFSQFLSTFAHFWYKCKSDSTFSWSLLWPAVTATESQTRKHPALVLASCAKLQQELGLWFCSQNLIVFWITLGCDCQMTSRGSELGHRFHLLWNQWNNWVEFEFFSGLL